MKNASVFVRGIRQLHLSLLRRYGRPRLPSVREPIDELMYAVLSRHAPEIRAMSAVDHLHRVTVDLNDLRVTPVVVLADLLGEEFPHGRETAEALSRVLNGVFNRRYTLDLTFLKSMSRRDAERLVVSLGGIDPHDVALFMLRVFRVHRVPVSPEAYRYLVHHRLLPEGSPHRDAQNFLERVIPASSAETFCCLLKRHVAAHPVPASGVPPPAVVVAGPASTPVSSAQEVKRRPGRAQPAASTPRARPKAQRHPNRSRVPRQGRRTRARSDHRRARRQRSAGRR